MCGCDKLGNNAIDFLRRSIFSSLLLLGASAPSFAMPPGWNETILPNDYGLPPSALSLNKIDCMVTVFGSNSQPLYTYWIKGVVGFDGDRPVYDFLNDLYISMTTAQWGKFLEFSAIEPVDRSDLSFDFQPDEVFSFPESQYGLHIGLGRNSDRQLIAQVQHKILSNYAVKSSPNVCFVW